MLVTTSRMRLSARTRALASAAAVTYDACKRHAKICAPMWSACVLRACVRVALGARQGSGIPRKYSLGVKHNWLSMPACESCLEEVRARTVQTKRTTGGKLIVVNENGAADTRRPFIDYCRRRCRLRAMAKRSEKAQSVLWLMSPHLPLMLALAFVFLPTGFPHPPAAEMRSASLARDNRSGKTKKN